MKIKGIIAIALVFSVLFALSSCGGIKSNRTIEESEVYVVDENGEECEVQAAVDRDTGETEYFYYDSDSKRVVVEAETQANGMTKYYATNAAGKKEEVTTKIVVKTETAPGTPSVSNKTSTPASGNSAAQSEFNGEFTGDIQDYTDAPTKPISLVLGDDIHDSGTPTKKGDEPVNNSVDFFENLAKKNKFTVKAINRTEYGGEVSTTPVTLIKSGNKMYFEASAPVDESGSTISMFIIIDSAAKTCNAYIPSVKVCSNIPYDSVDEMLGEYTSFDAEMGTYIGTVPKNVNGKQYTVDYYTADDGSTVQYYYDNGTPVRVESKSPDGTISITEYTISFTADESKLRTPVGYMSAEAFEGMLG
ncbi:MAG: hypothetical protein MJ125_02640 [Clostridia bacterium]|nr:hypothetical protein [Clostridia bacterium]